MNDGALNTTLGSCTICNSKRPPGSGVAFLGGGLLAVFGIAAVATYLLEGPQALTGLACAAAVVIGGPLLLWGVYRSVSFDSSFATGSVQLATATAHGGEKLHASFELMPDHSLDVRVATAELVALEDVDGAEAPKIVRSHEVKLKPPQHVREPLRQEFDLAIPRDWPESMESPSGVSPKVRIRSQVRVSFDFNAHPLFVLEAPVTITARR